MAKRRVHSAELKAKVAVAALKGERTTNEVASSDGVHPVQVSQWKKVLVEGAASVFGTRQERDAHAEAALRAELYQQIGPLTMEVEYLKKKCRVAD